MTMKPCLIFISKLLSFCYVVFALSEKKDVEIHKGDAVNGEQRQEFDAVQKLHIHLDDDKDGDVDFSESEKFLKHELEVKDNERHSKFHSGDDSVSVNDLWKAWQKSEERKWSPGEVVDWLKNVVRLPQYADVFKGSEINGHHLPRLASSDGGILVNKLKISNIIDRKKIALRAMDVVLFGAPRSDALTAERDQEFDAVQKLHIHLDEDKDGDVDFSESEEFLKHELKVKDNKRHSKFHSGDGSVSVNDLWMAWQKSEVSKWSPGEVVDWLTNVVHLPQYADVFKDNEINGHHLPRLASSDDGILVNKLKISNIIDRKKIALRAMDVVLFGAPKGHNYLKDLVLGLVVLVAIAGFWFSNIQKRRAQKQMEAMMKDVGLLQDAEKNLSSLQNRLQEAEASHQVIQQEKFQLESNLKNEIETAKREAQRLREAREGQSEETHTRLKLAEQELVQVREALRKAEKEVEYLSSEMSSSLQKWLQITYQKEVKNFQYRRIVAMKKMEEAKDACYRLKRKRGSLFGALRLAHDQYIDDVDQRILAARTSLAEVTSDLEELQYRWQQIETCCRLDLGVCTSFLWNESTDGCSVQTRLSGRTTLSTTSAISRESLLLHRVPTYPSFQSVGDNSPNTSDTAYEHEASDNGNNSMDALHDCNAGGLREQSRDSEYYQHEEDNGLSTTGKDKPIKLKNSSKNGSFCDDKPKKDLFSNSEEKNTGLKKKWWSRGKKHHSYHGNHETNSPKSNHLSRSKSSMPTLSQK